MGRWSKQRHAEEAAKKQSGKVASGSVPGTTVDDNPPTPAVPTPEKNPRNAFLEELAARDNPDTITGGQDTVEGAVKAEDKKPDAPAPEVVPPTPDPTPPAPQMVKVKIDGEEQEVSQADIDEAGGVVAYRTAKAGENRLKEAREALAEAKRMRDEMATLADKQPKQPSQTDEQFIASKIESVRFGTEAEAAAAIKEILSRSNPQINQDHVVNIALIQVRRQAALDKFGEEFSDILSNPELGKLSLYLEREEMAKIPQASINDPAFVGKFDWNNFYRSIGNRVRGAIGRPSQTTGTTAKATDQPSPSSAKEERKSSIVNLPAATAKAELPKEDKEPSREDILAEMRKTRGQIG